MQELASTQTVHEKESLGQPAAELRVSMILLHALADVVQQRGVAPDAFLGRDAAKLLCEPVERTLPLAQFQALLERGVRLTGEPALGLHCGLYASESSFGVMTPLVAHAPSLRHALALAVQFHPLVIEGIRLELTERVGVAEVRCELWHEAGGGGRSLSELMIAGLVRMLRAFGCARSEIQAVCFPYPRPAYSHTYSAAFLGTECYSQPFAGVMFCAQALDRPHLHRQAELYSLMLVHAERSLQRCTRPLTCTERVRALINTFSPDRTPDMRWAAHELRLSVRSLRRRLLEEGTSYRELTQAHLYETACAMLRNPTHTLQDIAHGLGFADSTAFHRAFRRWARRTPADYRHAAIGSGHVAPVQVVE